MKSKNGEYGVALVETVVALGILAIIAIAFLSGLTAAQKASIVADERATAESLAQSQLEHIKKVPYVFSAITYSPAPLPTGHNYTGYSVTISAAPVHITDDGIQKITITVTRNGQQITSLDGYKGNR